MMDDGRRARRWIGMRSSLRSLGLAAALLACGGKTATPPPVPQNQAPRPTGDPAAIRAIDWKHQVYDYAAIGSPDDGRYETHDGEANFVYDENANIVDEATYLRTHPGAEPIDRGYLSASAPTFGDLDGDGAEEAVQVTTLNTGGTGQFTLVWVFHLAGGKPQVLGVVPGGDRADGGVVGVDIDAGELIVFRYTGGEGACCPTGEQTERWRWTGKDFAEDVASRTSERYPAD